MPWPNLLLPRPGFRPPLILLFTVLAVLLVAGLSAWSETRERRTALELGRAESRVLSGLAKGFFLRAMDTFDFMAGELLAQARQSDSMAPGGKLDRMMTATPYLMDLLVLDGQGRITHWTGKGTPPDVRDRPYYRAHAEDRAEGLFIGRPRISRVHEDRWFFAVSRARRDARGQLAGVAVVIVDISRFASALSTTLPAHRASLGLFRRDGQTIVRLPRPEGAMGRKVAGLAALSWPLPRETSVTVISPFDEQRRVVSYRPVGDYPLIALASRSEESVLAAWRTGLGNRLGVAGLVMLLLTGAGLALYAQIRNARNAERRLAESEAFYREVLESQSDLIHRFLPDTTLTYVNEAFAALVGRSAEELTGHRWVDMLPPGEREAVLEPLRAMTPQAPVLVQENALPGADGRQHWVRWTNRAFFNSEGTLTHFQATGQDITTRREAEAEMERSNAELERFAYAVSHDLQEPLRSVSGFLDLLQRRFGDSLPDKGRDYVTRAREGALRMHAMIQGLLEYSRVTTQAQPPEPLPAAEAVEEALSNLAGAIRDSGALVRIEALPTINVDRPQVVRLFQNLIGNALKYSHPDRQPAITVTAEDTADDTAEFSVIDNGVGIRTRDRERAFMLFQRLEGGRNTATGTGVGLALCKRIVERHDGSIRVDSEEGVGTTVSFTLPRAPSGTA